MLFATSSPSDKSLGYYQASLTGRKMCPDISLQMYNFKLSNNAVWAFCTLTRQISETKLYSAPPLAQAVLHNDNGQQEDAPQHGLPPRADRASQVEEIQDHSEQQYADYS